ncbi:hypothetical protein [Portibacter marinus]|uniref:hypothetical protein n=1 Tax=Portibacter marinus TaxID=2898660 RepID=UPI001F1BE34F|nr:hypothetical protein [Portibacter marinus]
MRLVAFILAITVVFLAFKPGMTLLSQCETEIACCTDTCEPFSMTTNDEKPADQGCNGNSCNPFQSCGSSFVFTAEKLALPSTNPGFSTESNFSYQFNHLSQFATDFWQPPQLA